MSEEIELVSLQNEAIKSVREILAWTQNIVEYYFSESGSSKECWVDRRGTKIGEDTIEVVQNALITCGIAGGFCSTIEHIENFDASKIFRAIKEADNLLGK